jgi:hypothetical protein
MTLNLVDQAGKLTQAGLAVIGAAVLGAIFVGFIVNFMTTLVFGKRLPPMMVRWVRILAALASGIAVGLIVFSGTGGFGLGGGYGPGDSGAGAPTPVPAATLTGGSPQPAAPLRVGITVLGGSRVRGEAFYQLDNEPTPKSLTQLQPRLTAAIAGTVALRLYDDSVSRDHAAVTELIALAERGGWKVVIEEFKGQSLPPEANRS